MSIISDYKTVNSNLLRLLFAALSPWDCSKCAPLASEGSSWHYARPKRCFAKATGWCSRRQGMWLPSASHLVCLLELAQILQTWILSA